jgi:hypothetical protein
MRRSQKAEWPLVAELHWPDPSMPTFQEVFDEYAFLAYEKQVRLSSLIGDHEWRLDTRQAKVTFAKRQVFDVYFLGTESSVSNTWFWADANQKSHFPARSLEMCRTLRSIGREEGLVTFEADSFAFADRIGEPTGHTLAMVAICLANASCYYRGPHETGAVYFMMKDSRIDSKPDLDLQHFAEGFKHLMWIAGDMKARLLSYFVQKGYMAKPRHGDKLTCRLYTGEQVSFEFKPTMEGGVSITCSFGE